MILLLLLALAWTAQAQISTAGLELRLNFDGSGQTVSDSSGHGNDCRLGSTSGSDANDPARVTEGLQFDGGDFVDCLRTTFGTTSLFAQGSEQFTVQVVVLQPSDATAVFVARSGTQRVFEVGSESGAGGRGRLRGTVSTIEAPTPANEWHLWTVRWDGSTATARLDNEGNVALAAGSGTDTTENLSIGARSISTGGADFLPNGSKIAVALVYDRSLQDAEMRRQYCGIREYVAGKSVALPDAHCPSGDAVILASMTFLGAPLVVTDTAAGANAVTMTDCQTLAASLWISAGLPSQPFEVPAGETQLGDACDPFDAMQPVRQ